MKNSTKIAAYVLAVIMISTGILYLSVALDEYKEHQQEARAEVGENEEHENERSERAESNSSGPGPLSETVFFSIVGAAYLSVGLWMLKRKEGRRPYIVALIGSALLIAFYVATRTVNIPMIGLQDDIGAPDITAKILQGVIVAISAFMIIAISRKMKKEIA